RTTPTAIWSPPRALVSPYTTLFRSYETIFANTSDGALRAAGRVLYGTWFDVLRFWTVNTFRMRRSREFSRRENSLDRLIRNVFTVQKRRTSNHVPYSTRPAARKAPSLVFAKIVS